MITCSSYIVIYVSPQSRLAPGRVPRPRDFWLCFGSSSQPLIFLQISLYMYIYIFVFFVLIMLIYALRLLGQGFCFVSRYPHCHHNLCRFCNFRVLFFDIYYKARFVVLRRLLEDHLAATLGLIDGQFMYSVCLGMPVMYSFVMLYDILKIPSHIWPTT